MLFEPLHPLVVHFPIVFVVILPILAVVALWGIRRGARPARAWAVVVAVAVALFVASFVSVRTGEAQEDRVEAVVPESALHTHEEAAERFLLLSGILVLVTATGLIGGTAGRWARGIGTAGAVVVLLAGVQVGHSGGELVYRHGAANAYVPGAAPAEYGAAAPVEAGREEAGEDGG